MAAPSGVMSAGRSSRLGVGASAGAAAVFESAKLSMKSGGRC